MADNNFNEIFEKITSNPDIIEKLSSITKDISKENPYDSLPNIIDAISPAFNSIKQEENTDKTDTPPKETSENKLAIPIAKLGEKITKNSKLLIALKPYLCKERCEIIDTVVKIAQASDIMKFVK